MLRSVVALLVWMPAAPAQLPTYKPAGMVLGNGATIQRGNQPATRVQTGELVFQGDVLRTGTDGVLLLSCTQTARLRLSPSAEIHVSDGQWVLKAGSITAKEPAGPCYLPESPKLSLASQQHFGVLAARSGSIPPPIGTFEQRIDSVAEPKRTELKSALAKVDSALREDPADASAHISRAAILEQSGLLYDAGESYRTAAVMMPGAAWLRRKVIEIENKLLAAKR